MKTLERIRAVSRRAVVAGTPSTTAWHGATVAICVFAAVVVATYFTAYVVQNFALEKVPAFFVAVGVVAAIGAAVLVGLLVIRRLPLGILAALLIVAPFPLMSLSMGDEKSTAIFYAVLLLVVSFIGAGIAVLRQQGLHPGAQKVTLTVFVFGVAGLLGGLYAIFSEKEVANPHLADYVIEDRTLDLPNPGLPGSYDVLTLSYGSGSDPHREDFGAGADLISRSVDGSKLIENWDGISGWLRSSYWGFDASALPLQARVWYPAGDGPFPLALVVHGNHSMEDFSDPGYAYLGEHFASRGIIFASVDENFLNSSFSARVNYFVDRPGLKEENDARGWMLLQHLSLWRDWNVEEGHSFYGKVDIDRVALVGHSRGGEAVGVAAAFNALDRYPDDATLKFDFDFNLRGVISIAPVYGQYKARKRYTPVIDVNFFTIHGDMDGDVQSFEGLAQYARVGFSGGVYRFKSALYVVGANHGQFNTSWGNKDTSWFRAWALDLDGIMDGEAQRDVARVYFGAFMEVVLHDNDAYLSIFRDAEFAAKWLPGTFYVNQFADSETMPLADFEEDIDPTTTASPGGMISTENLSKWYEVANKLKYDELDTHSAVFAWDSVFSAETARVDFRVSPAVASDSDATLSASLSTLDIDTLPEDWESDKKDDDGEQKGTDTALDWTVVVTDNAGQTAGLPLSHDQKLYQQINAIPRRAGFLDSTEPREVIFRRFAWVLRDFEAVNTDLDTSALEQISFVFDRSDKGVIIVDDLSLSN